MDYFLTYFILRLDALSMVSGVLSIVTGIVFAVTLLICAINYNDEEAKTAARPWVISFSIAFSLTLLLVIGSPSTKQAAVIYCLPKIVNNNQVKQIPDNLLRLANQWIDDQITETTETVTEVAETVTKAAEIVVESVETVVESVEN